MNSSLSTIHLI